ncbi:hypothetical protein J4403_04185 [Candidatus Woesearchaeota archaeon]|nr:hypothetical protein [Candidatus Woesearchaeota archaeon]
MNLKVKVCPTCGKLKISSSKLPKEFKYRIELQDKKGSSLFSMPLNEQEFDKLLKYDFKVRYRKTKKG